MTEINFAFTPVPKWYFSIYRDLTKSENFVLLTIFNQLYGWPEDRARGYIDITYTELGRSTGLSRASIAAALAGLRRRGLLDQDVSRVQSQRLTILHPQLSVQKVDSAVQNMNQEAVQNMNQEAVQNMNQRSYSIKNLKPEESTKELIAVVVETGLFDISLATAIAETALRNGRDPAYLKRIAGYVAKHSQTNPAGMFRKLVESNEDRFTRASGKSNNLAGWQKFLEKGGD